MSNGVYRAKQQRKFEEAADSCLKEANEVSRELSRQLILVGSVLIPISAFVLNAGDLSKSLTICDKWLLLFSWFLIVSSIILGIIQFAVDHCFFSKWADAKYKIAKSIHDDPNITKTNKDGTMELDKLVQKSQEGIRTESSQVYTWIQAISIILGMILLAVIMGKILFYAPEFQQHNTLPPV